MAGVSSVSGLSSLSEDLYYQYMINHNSTSTMLNALSGDTSEDSGAGSLLGAVTSSLYPNGISDLYGMESLGGLGSLLGTGGDDLLTASQSLSSFSNILQAYLNAQTAEAAQMTEKLSDVLEEASQTEDTSTLSYRTVQEIYQYFLEKSSSSGENAVQSQSSAGRSQSASQGMVYQQAEVDFDSMEQQLQQQAESAIPAIKW